MASKAPPDFFEYFSAIDDPRVQGRCLYSIQEIFLIVVCGTLAGCDGPSEMVEFAKCNLSWFRKFVGLKHGVPSHDTVSRIFNLVKPDQFAQVLYRWISDFFPGTVADETAKTHLIAIDGKTVRGSARKSKNMTPLHLLSAWSVSYRMTLAQVAVSEKSNEITALPDLLELLELRGAIVSIDAMGTQKSVASAIVDGGGDYVLALKGNHQYLCDEVSQVFDDMASDDAKDHAGSMYKTEERGHGRDEVRTYYQISLPEELGQYKDEWSGLESIGYVASVVQREGKETSEVRMFLSSLAVDVKKFAESVRGHWQIENGLHYVLDVTLSEDMTQTYLKRAVINFATVRRFVVSLVKQDTSEGSIKRKRKRAGWDTDFLESLIFGPVLMR